MENDKGSVVHLVWAIHIWSPKYYEELFSILTNDNDVVLYEQIRRSDKPKKRDKFIFLNKISLSKLYQNLSKEINTSTNHKLYEVFNKLIKKDPNKKSIYEKQKHDISKQMEIVSQWDAINYSNLPQSWEHADVTIDEITAKTKIFSWQNIKFLRMKIWVAIAKSKFFVKRIAKRFISRITYDNLKKWSSLDKISKIREQKVFDKIDRRKHMKSKTWILYWSYHLSSMENELSNKWYKRKDIQWITAITKMPKIDELAA
jgi:hypothetical protein